VGDLVNRQEVLKQLDVKDASRRVLDGRMADDRLKFPKRVLLCAVIIVGRHVAPLKCSDGFVSEPLVFRRIGSLHKVRRDIERNPVGGGVTEFSDVLEPFLQAADMSPE
jgi:hypothetical protein